MGWLAALAIARLIRGGDSALAQQPLAAIRCWPPLLGQASKLRGERRGASVGRAIFWARTGCYMGGPRACCS